MARGARLRALYRVREALEHAHSNLLTSTADPEMRRWTAIVAHLIARVEQKIKHEEGRLAHLEADEAAARLSRQEEEEEDQDEDAPR